MKTRSMRRARTAMPTASSHDPPQKDRRQYSPSAVKSTLWTLRRFLKYLHQRREVAYAPTPPSSPEVKPKSCSAVTPVREMESLAHEEPRFVQEELPCRIATRSAEVPRAVIALPAAFQSSTLSAEAPVLQCQTLVR